MNTIRAVIFDMDGVLIDSEPVYLMHQYEALKDVYPWITKDSFRPTVGMSGQDYPGFMAGLCRRENDEAFQAELDAIFAHCKVDYAQIMRPEVPEVLRTLAADGYQLALASSSSRENIDQVLSECGIADYFSVILSGREFNQSKPDPEIYLKTMDLLGCEPGECLIVEDSTYGIAAGVAAKGVVAALRDERFGFDQSKASLTMESLSELPAIAACGGRHIGAAFFDVDGTLISIGSHKMPASVAQAINRLRRNGVAVFLCTGRHRLEIEEEQLLPGLAFDGAVYMNGQICEWRDEIILENPIPAADLKALRTFLEESGRSCIFLERSAMYANRVDDWMVAEQARIGTAVPPVQSIEGLEKRKIYQVIPFVTPDEEAQLLSRMPSCRTKRWGEFVVDLMSENGGKENGIRALCAAMGLDTDCTIAFGDADNDIEMLEFAGVGVAMGNAEPHVQACADLVTECVEDDGISKALARLHLI